MTKKRKYERSGKYRDAKSGSRRRKFNGPTKHEYNQAESVFHKRKSRSKKQTPAEHVSDIAAKAAAAASAAAASAAAAVAQAAPAAISEEEEREFLQSLKNLI